MSEKATMTLAEVAHELDCSTSTVERAARRGDEIIPGSGLKAFKAAGARAWRCSRSQFYAALRGEK